MAEDHLSPLGRFDRILLATDGSQFSEGAIRVAGAMAEKCDAKLMILSIALYSPQTVSLEPALEARAEKMAWSNVNSAKEKIGHSDCLTFIRQESDPAKAIYEAAEELRADLIIMGRHGRRGLARWKLGHATAKVVGHAPCAVMVVPSAANPPSKRILVATDGSRYGDAAAIVARKMAAYCGLPVTVVSAVIASHSAERRQEAKGAIERVKAGLDADGVSTNAHLAEGHPDQAILDSAKRDGADLIIMGSHGRSGLEKMLMGSVSEKVLNQAECPVLVVRGS